MARGVSAPSDQVHGTGTGREASRDAPYIRSSELLERDCSQHSAASIPTQQHYVRNDNVEPNIWVVYSRVDAATY
jgi:hypothetical protein